MTTRFRRGTNGWMEKYTETDEECSARRASICYTPELDDEETSYSWEDFLAICHGNEDAAEILADVTIWTSPYTKYDELVSEGDFIENEDGTLTVSTDD